jgi:hypothetical protein
MAGMSRRDLVFVLCRAIALFLLIPALLSILTLPYEIFIARHLSEVFPNKNLHERFALIEIVLGSVARLAIGFMFWRCGPMIEKLFASPNSD